MYKPKVFWEMLMKRTKSPITALLRALGRCRVSKCEAACKGRLEPKGYYSSRKLISSVSRNNLAFLFWRFQKS